MTPLEHSVVPTHPSLTVSCKWLFCMQQICRGGPKTFHFYLLNDFLCYSGKMFAGLPSQAVIPLLRSSVYVVVGHG